MNRSLFLLLVFLLLTWLTSQQAPPVFAAPAIPRHRISLSFAIKDGLVNGTSQLMIPPDTPLQLACGPLRLTGLVLEQSGKTPQTLKIGENNTLAVPPSPGEQRLTISWQLQVTPAGDGDNLLRTDSITLAGFWHPVADRDLLFSLEAVIPHSFEAICEADTSHTAAIPGGKRVIASFAQPLRNLHFVAGPYVVQSRQLDGVTLATCFFKEDAALAPGYLEKTADLIRRYQLLIGPFPYQRFTVAENRLPTGYGMPGFTLLGQAVIRLPFIKESSLGHEVLHSWFGNSIQVSDHGGNWSEGLTTYLADQSFALDGGQGPRFRKDQLIRYRAYVHPAKAIPLNIFQNPGDNRPIDRAIRAVGYDKSSMVFHMLRLHIGETAFQAGLQHFYQQMRGRRAGWQELETSFSLSSGKDLKPFFQQWLARTDLPKIAIENTKIDQRQGRAIISFDLVQATPAPYLLDIPIRIATLNGETGKTLHTDSARQPVSLELDSLPTSLVVDGGYDVMRELKPEELPPTWSQFLGAEGKTVIAPSAASLRGYQPLIDSFRQAGWSIVSASEVKNSMLAQGSWLFLGDSALRRSLFAEPMKTADGLTLDVRRSPLNPKEVMVLIDSGSEEESGMAVAKFNHYGPFSRLRFSKGKNLEKTTSPSTDGIKLPLLEPPGGIPMQATRTFEEIVEHLARARVVYVGETHTDYSSHLLQLQILQALHARGKKIVIGLEMFPRSSQQALDDYIQGKSDEVGFIKASNYFSVWGFDYRLYRDILNYARAQRIPLIGLNLDKEITRQVFASGSTDRLTVEQQAQMAKERDLDSAKYRQRLQIVHDQHDSPHGAGFTGFLQAQALWDETMAESVAKSLDRSPGVQVLVLAGNGHVVKDSGIPSRVARRLPRIEQLVVTGTGGMEVDEGQVDYLMFTQPIELAPAGKLGIIFKEEGKEGEEGRVRVSGLSPHGLAGKAGLEAEDRILAIDDTPVSGIADIRISLLDKKVGEMVELRVLRGRKQRTVTVELSALTKETGAALPPDHPKP